MKEKQNREKRGTWLFSFSLWCKAQATARVPPVLLAPWPGAPRPARAAGAQALPSARRGRALCRSCPVSLVYSSAVAAGVRVRPPGPRDGRPSPGRAAVPQAPPGERAGPRGPPGPALAASNACAGPRNDPLAGRSSGRAPRGKGKGCPPRQPCPGTVRGCRLLPAGGGGCSGRSPPLPSSTTSPGAAAGPGREEHTRGHGQEPAMLLCNRLKCFNCR